MEEKKVTKISVSTFFLVLAIIAIGVMGFFIYKLNDDKNKEANKVSELNNQVKDLTKTVDELKATANNNISNSTNTINNNTTTISTNEIGKIIKEKLSDTDGKDLYDKAMVSKQFMSLLITNKKFSNVEFSDEEIVKLLVELDKDKVFTDASNSEGFYVSAKLDDVQKLAKKYFGKELNANQLTGIKDNQILVEVPSGFGIITDKFVSGYEMDNGDYFLTFEQIEEGASGSLTYGLFIKYDKTTDTITYKGFTNDIISYVSQFNSKN